MFNSIFGKTVYEKRWIILAWFGGLAFMGFLTMFFFPYLKNSFGAISNSIPKSLEAVLGNASSYQTVRGYVSEQIFALRMPLISLIMSISIFIGLSGGDEERGTLETLLAQPVSRAKVFWQKFAAGGAITALASVGIWLGVVLSFPFIHGSMSLWNLALATFACWLVSLAFGALAYGFGAAIGAKGAAIGIVSAFAFLSYLVTSLAPSVNKLQQAQKASLLYYYNTPSVTLNGLHIANILVLIGVCVVACLVSLLIFTHRDLRKT